jgi:CubicO group peptidase (beta-lactamase class C family)
MRKGLITSYCLTAVVVLAFHSPQLAAQTNLAAQADATVKTFKQDAEFSGVVLIARNGKILFEKAYGQANREWNIPNTTRTKFRIASLTKQFTAAAILLLQEKRKLRVSENISQYIDDLPSEWRQITIHQLLTHTSGLPEYTSPPEVEKVFNLTGATPEQLLNLVRQQPIKFAPGKKFLYCNTGYLLLGMIIKKVSGSDYPSFLKQNILSPLQLDDTGYDIRPEILPRRASGYWMKNGRLENAGYVDASVPFAAGGLYSTVEDLYKWNEALATGRLLSADSQRAMFTPYPEAELAGMHYGYGVVLTEKFGQPRYFHGGGIQGFASSIERYPQSNICIVVLSNEDEVKSWDLATRLAGLLLGKQ